MTHRRCFWKENPIQMFIPNGTDEKKNSSSLHQIESPSWFIRSFSRRKRDTSRVIILIWLPLIGESVVICNENAPLQHTPVAFWNERNWNWTTPQYPPLLDERWNRQRTKKNQTVVPLDTLLWLTHRAIAFELFLHILNSVPLTFDR